DRLAAQRSVHAGRLDRPGNRVQVHGNGRRHGHRVVNRYVIAPPVAVAEVLLVLGLDVDASAALVDLDLHPRQLAAVAARALDRVDRDLVARSAGDGDVAGD